MKKKSRGWSARALWRFQVPSTFGKVAVIQSSRLMLIMGLS